MINIEKLETQVLNFRHALDQIDWSQSSLKNCKDFPRGVCGIASDVLAEHLYDLGYFETDIITVIAKNGEASHAWLEINGYIVDITADQFDEYNKPFLVFGYSDFHSKYNEISRNKAGYKNVPFTDDQTTIYTLANKILNDLE